MPAATNGGGELASGSKMAQIKRDPSHTTTRHFPERDIFPAGTLFLAANSLVWSSDGRYFDTERKFFGSTGAEEDANGVDGVKGVETCELVF